MHASQLLQVINRLPFEPFEIRTTSGKCLSVEHASQIATSPNSASCAVYEADGGTRIIALGSITEILPFQQLPMEEQQHRREIAFIVLCWIVVFCMVPQILYMTGITPTGPLLGLNLIQSVALAVVITFAAYLWLSRKFWK